ncbi:hypothetical protein IMC75_05850 [Campylobacter peloridis]|uniref:Uncharacterized protein n=1 Tax=Campylobacter peloridis TaxID=488546 RepID=A0A5C7DTI3_9BACT|nr:hypothetical protein [Campylobacter peloridis]AJC84386.1 hypothetical membrane protein [Campylobacter peloridis LMG 23910]QOQ88481.1 hypothetical protein IMC75_05850 [Campylobacter peloridis]TXE78907.1 hypothetical protein FPD46_07670 [Campylobacter peloridis]
MILKIKILLYLLLGLNLTFLAGIFFFKEFDFKFFISFEFGFLAQNLIIFVSFFNYKNFIIKNAKNYNFRQKPLQIFTKKQFYFPKIVKFVCIDDDLKPKFKFIFKNALVFFSLFKILAYVFLILGFLALEFQGIMDIFSLFCAMFVTPLAVLIYNFIIRKC